MVGWICFGAVGVGGAVVVLSRVRRYRRLLADEHFLEIARAASRLKGAALWNVILSDGDMPKSPDDPRICLTTRGLAIVYTVQQDGQRFIHHCSVGLAGGITTHAVGGLFLAFVTKLLGLPWARMSFGVAASTVHHGELVVGPEEHQSISSLVAPAPSLESIAVDRRVAFGAKNHFAWNRAGA